MLSNQRKKAKTKVIMIIKVLIHTLTMKKLHKINMLRTQRMMKRAWLWNLTSLKPFKTLYFKWWLS